MKMPNITPGPWITDSHEHDHPYQNIKIKAGSRTVCQVWIDDAPVHDYNAEQERNAKAIAAVPDLIESAIGLLEVISVRIDDPRIEKFDALKLALLKAGCTE